jgi:phosphoribosylanthranilate isomerase
MTKPRVKICCISSLVEAELAVRYGASALGLVSAMPSGPGVIEEDLIAEIVARVPPPIATFLLTSLQDAARSGIHVTGEESVAEVVTVASQVDAILLDSGNQNLAVKELGGTGRTHDWTLSRKIRETAGVPIFLAGGLKPENVGEAIRAVEPFGLDLCSGVRTDRKLDEARLARFFERVAGA